MNNPIPTFARVALLASIVIVPLSAQITVLNGDFSSAIVNDSSVSQGETGWRGNSVLSSGTSATANWSSTMGTDATFSTSTVKVTGYDGQAVGRTGNSGFSRHLVQVINGASTALGGYSLDFDYTVVDGTATNPVSFTYQVWGLKLNGGTMAAITTNPSVTTPASVTITGGTSPQSVALVDTTLSLGSSSSNSTVSSSIAATFDVDQAYDRYVVIFSIAGGHTGAAANTTGTWIQGQTNNFIALDNVAITAVPEPSAFAALAGAAVLGAVAYRRRRRA